MGAITGCTFLMITTLLREVLYLCGYLPQCSRKRLQVLELIHSLATSKQQSWDADLGLSAQVLCILWLANLGLAASLDDGVKQAAGFR